MKMKERERPVPNQEQLSPVYIVEKWTPEDVPEIIALEQATWAPWLQKPEEGIRTIANKYADTQLLLRDPLTKKILATLTANRIHWDGNPDKLTSWDIVAGGSRGSIGQSDYTETYQRNGNTLCLMSMDVLPEARGTGVAPLLIEEMKKVAQEIGAEHLIGPFRPSHYGMTKLEEIARWRTIPSFETYCNALIPKKKGPGFEPYDHWLRTTSRLGMKRLRIEKESMTVTVPYETFQKYQAEYNPELWVEWPMDRWECGETGTWSIRTDDKGSKYAEYVEANLWGEIPLMNPPNTSHRI